MKGKIIHKNTWFKMLIMACTLTLLAGVLAGCGEKPADNTGNNEEVTQVAEEVEEQPTVEPAPSEEPEVVEPEPSEEPKVVEPMPSEEPEVVEPEPEEELDLSQYYSYMDLLNDMDYDELKITVWNMEGEGRIILSDGDSYTMKEYDWLYLYFPEENLSVSTNKEYVHILNVYETDCYFIIPDVGENLEVPFTATAPDGTEYEITVYLSKDFEWDGY